MSSTTKKCTRCGADVPSIMSPPPGDRDIWHRYLIGMRRVEVAHKMRFRMFTRKWLPERSDEQVRETYTELDLCDPCARAVLLFAQDLQNVPISPVVD